MEVYADCGGGFSVDFPRRASKLERERIDEDGVKGMLVSRNLPDVELAVGWSQMPMNVVKAKGAVRLLRDVMQGRAGDTEIIDEERISETMGAQTLAYTFHRAHNAGEKDAPADGRVLLVLTPGGMLYQVQALGRMAGTVKRAETKAFIESFHLVQCK